MARATKCFKSPQLVRAGARQETVQGVRTPQGNCLFNYQLALAPNEKQVVHEELAYDPDTCQTLVQIGRDDSNTDRHTAATGTTVREEYPADVADNDGPGVTRRLSPQYDGGSLPPPYTGGVITSKGTMYSYTKDPCPIPCITVNSVERQIESDWDGANAVYVNTIEWYNWYKLYRLGLAQLGPHHKLGKLCQLDVRVSLGVPSLFQYIVSGMLGKPRACVLRTPNGIRVQVWILGRRGLEDEGRPLMQGPPKLPFYRADKDSKLISYARQ